MALVKYQEPFWVNKNYVHSYTYPAYYTIYNELFEEINYRYKCIVSDVNGTVITTKNPPVYNSGIGIFNVNSILKNNLSFVFNPNIVNFKPCAGTAIQYRLDVEDTGITNITTASFNKTILLKAYKENFNLDDYVLNAENKSVLTDWTSTRKVTLEDRGTLRALSGTMVNINYTDFISYLYRTIIVKTTSNGNRYWYRSELNPNYYSTTFVGLSEDNEVLQSLDNYVLDFPAYPWNINKMLWTLYKREVLGEIEELPLSLVSNILSNAVSYELYTRDAGDNVTSKSEYFTIIDACNIEPVQLAWENAVGGIDYATITKYKSKTNSYNKETFIKNKYQQGHNPSHLGNNFYVGATEYDRGETILNNKTSEKWTLNTDWLTKEEFIDYSGMFDSSNVFMRIKDTWYPVILLNENTVVETDIKGLKNLTISLRLSNKKYIS